MSNTGGLSSAGISVNAKKYTVNKVSSKELTDITTSYESKDYKASEYNNEIYNNINEEVESVEELKTGEINKSDNVLLDNNDNSIEESTIPTSEEVFDFLKKVNDYTFTAVASVTCGVFEVVENISDGLFMAGGVVASSVASILGEDEVAEEIKSITSEIVSYDWTEAMYNSTVEYHGIDEEIAYGTVHKVGNAVGTTTGYIALTLATGGSGAAVVTTSALAAAGSSTEVALNSGATFEEAAVVGTVSSVIGGVSGGLLDKFKGVQSGVTGAKEVVKSASKAAGVSIIEPVVNTITEYSVYGKDMTDENGKKLGLLDYYTQSGGLLNTAIAGVVGFGSSTLGNIKGNKIGDIDVSNDKSLEQLPSQANSVSNYHFDRDGTIEYLCELKDKGYSDIQIIEEFAEYGYRCKEYFNKRAFADISYEYLLSLGYSPEDSANILIEVYNNNLKSRGMTEVYVDKDGIKYNFINQFNQQNQAYTLEYVIQQIEELPAELRKSINEVNFYDTFNPADYYWQAKYKNDGNSIFRSAATGGNGVINLWSNESVGSHVITHEAGHCFDSHITDASGNSTRLHSDSQEYLKAIFDDKALSGKNSITPYGDNGASEDFADAMAAYKGKYLEDGIDINDFPNRKAYIEKHIKVDNQSYLSVYNANQLIGVSNTLSQKYGGDQVASVFYQYVTTGDITKITRDNGARDIVANMDINEVIEFYNILVGG